MKSKSGTGTLAYKSCLLISLQACKLYNTNNTGLAQFLESLWVAGLCTFLRTHVQLSGGWIPPLPVNGWEGATSINPEIANLDSFLRTIYHLRRPSSSDSHGFYNQFFCSISSLLRPLPTLLLINFSPCWLFLAPSYPRGVIHRGDWQSGPVVAKGLRVGDGVGVWG